jgi:hydrogenase nickel incorporation protein HypA/HybF
MSVERSAMHEFALAEGVAVTAVQAAEKEGLQRITRLTVVIGELQQIERELFAEVLQQVMPETHAELADVAVELRTQPAVLRCRSCEHQYGMAKGSGDLGADEAEAIHFIPELAHTYLRCPVCASPDFEVVEGRGVWLDTVEGAQ